MLVRVMSAALIGSLAAAASAQAKTCWVTSDPAPIERIVVVEAESSTWTKLEARRAARVAWLVDADASAAIEAHGEAFIATLDRASAPSVEVPGSTADALCGRIPAVPRAPRTLAAPERVQRIETAAELEQYLSGYSAHPDDCALDLPIIAVEFELPSTSSETRALRSSGEGEVALRTSFLAPITFLTLGPGRARWMGAQEIRASSFRTTYSLATATSDYEERRDAALDASPGTSVVREAVLPLIAADDGPADVRLPWLTTYDRAEAPTLAGDCLAELTGVLALVPSTAFGPACPISHGDVSGFPPLPPCEETPSSEEVSAALLRCGTADDFSLALAGLALSTTWVTRTSARVERGTSRERVFEPATTEAPRLLASSVDSSGCATSRTEDLRSGSSGNSAPRSEGTDGAPAEVSTSTPQSPATTVVVDDGESCSAGASGPAEGSDSTDSESCSSNSSSSEASCSGSSEPSSSKDDSCSKHSSSTNEDGSDSCGKGSGNGEGASDDSCSGSSSPAEGEDSCSGPSSASADDSGACSIRGESRSAAANRSSSPRSHHARRSARRRPRVSLLTLCISAFLLPLRRFGRTQREGTSASPHLVGGHGALEPARQRCRVRRPRAKRARASDGSGSA